MMVRKRAEVFENLIVFMGGFHFAAHNTPTRWLKYPLNLGLQLRLALLGPQRDHWINFGRAARRYVTRHEGHNDQGESG